MITKLNEYISTNKTYYRVIPRDLFNEAKLLKCMGLLSLKIHDKKLPDGIDIKIEENGEPFEITQDESSGNIRISNYETRVNNISVRFATSLNSKSPYPLSCILDDESELAVFDDNGDFDSEFIEYFTT